MYFKIKCLGIETEIRWDRTLHPDQVGPSDRQAKNYIRNVVCGGCFPPPPDERIAFYRELEAAAVSVTENGPDEKYSAAYRLEHAEPAVRELYRRMELALKSGNPAVRRSNRSGLVVFTCRFPRWWSDGKWTNRGSQALSPDIREARRQMAFAGL